MHKNFPIYGKFKAWFSKVQNQITWHCRPETNKDIKALVENTDYEIKITERCIPSIHRTVLCKCGKKRTLGIKGTSVMLGNWKQHIEKYFPKVKAEQPILKGTQLHKFFKKPSSSSHSSVTIKRGATYF